MPYRPRRTGGVVKILVIVAVMAIGILTTGAYAADVAIKGSVTETLEGSDNYFLATKPSGATGKTNTAGILNFYTGTPDTRILSRYILQLLQIFWSRCRRCWLHTMGHASKCDLSNESRN